MTTSFRRIIIALCPNQTDTKTFFQGLLCSIGQKVGVVSVLRTP